ncbi:hypothetical protein BKD30_13570 [Tersicoccus phoenicis]|uniref:Uncharacterized protein n=1 Tax=Tersicoccus phoenicis TaxID=554083 RepID=A0A1R1L6W3_9MICC|nr:hypothetical protein [Tersicoccus phoenicis]OMH23253.1 hypothetical protein BKD30_13570 [Tersicoccus phoenicis]
MKDLYKAAAAVALATGLSVSAATGANAAIPPSGGLPHSAVGSATVKPAAGYVWISWQDDFYSLQTCQARAFWVVSTHNYIHDYQCKPQVNGRWNLLVLMADGINTPG